MHNKHKLHENKIGSVFASYIATVLIVMLVISVFSIVKAQEDIVPTAKYRKTFRLRRMSRRNRSVFRLRSIFLRSADSFILP